MNSEVAQQDGGLGIDIPEVPVSSDISIDSPSLDADIPNLDADIPNLSADMNEHTMSIDTSALFDQAAPSPAIESSPEGAADNLSIDMGAVNEISNQGDLNDSLSIDMNSDFSIDPVTNVADSPALDDVSITSADMFPSSSELQYTDSYGASSS